MLRYVMYAMNLTEQGCVVIGIHRSGTGSGSPNMPKLVLFSCRSHAMAERRCIWLSTYRIQTWCRFW